MRRTLIAAIAIFMTLALGIFAGKTAWHQVREFLYARQPAALRPCIGELKQIDGAKNTWFLEQHKSTNDIPTVADLVGPDKYLRAMPVCPNGGSYTIGAVSEKPRCSIPGHTI